MRIWGKKNGSWEFDVHASKTGVEITTFRISEGRRWFHSSWQLQQLPAGSALARGIEPAFVVVLNGEILHIISGSPIHEAKRASWNVILYALFERLRFIEREFGFPFDGQDELELQDSISRVLAKE